MIVSRPGQPSPRVEHPAPVRPLVRRGLRLLLVLVLALWLLPLQQPELAFAASITVTTTADTIDAAANCTSVTLASLPGPGGQTSLREAVCAANSNAGSDTITFSVNGTFALTGAANEDNGGVGDLISSRAWRSMATARPTRSSMAAASSASSMCSPRPPAAFDLSNLTVQNGDTRTTTFQEGGAMYLHNNVTSTFTGIRSDQQLLRRQRRDREPRQPDAQQQRDLRQPDPPGQRHRRRRRIPQRRRR